MNVPGTFHQPRTTVRVCSECYNLMRSERDCCSACGDNMQRREAWERVAAMLVVGWLVGALVFQLVH